jgi:hypothetical protein
MADIVYPGVVAGGPIGAEYLPKNYDLVLYRGDYISMSVTLKDSLGVPLNLTGYTAKCSIRKDYSAATSYDAICTVNAATGKILVEFPSSVTTDMAAGDYIWDFQTTISGNNRTYFAGDVKVYGEVAK